jgi:hypothetical protein
VIQLACEIHALGVTLIWMQDTAVPNRKASQNVKVEATFADVSCPDMEVSRLFSPRANGKSDGTTLAISPRRRASLRGKFQLARVPESTNRQWRLLKRSTDVRRVGNKISV